MTVAEMNLIFVDVEADGDTPISGVMAQFGAVHYGTRKSFHGLLHDSEPSPENPAKPRLIGNAYPRKPVLQAFASWVNQFPGRPIFVSDNPGWDFMWMACAFDEVSIQSPFGHSSRRIGDFYAGLLRNFRNSTGWKRWRVTPHTHHPVDDAMGNVEAFDTMLQRLP